MVLLPTLPAPAHVLKVKSEGEQRHCGTKRSFTIIMRMATLEGLFDKRYFLEAPSCIALIKASAVEVACEPSRQARLRIFFMATSGNFVNLYQSLTNRQKTMLR